MRSLNKIFERRLQGSCSSLWENREALEKYLKRLKELMEDGVPLKSMDDNIPRRIRIYLMEPAELSICNAILEVEKIGADVRLTNAVVKLSEAQNLIADYIDEKLNESVKTFGSNR